MLTTPAPPGNRSATFPLQLLGWEVDVVNTTQLSNHTGYGRFGGMRLDAAHLQSVFRGMEENGLLRYARMLSGYIPSPSALAEVTAFVKKMKGINPDLIYLLDPVMGDMGRGFYVDRDCLPLYKQLVGLAFIICPNQFEAQALADVQIDSLSSLHNALDCLHSTGTPHVIITSVSLPTQELDKIGAGPGNDMVLIGSTRTGDSDSQPWFIAFPEYKGYFSGVGDLFSALLLGRFDPAQHSLSTSLVGTPLSTAAEKAIAGVQGVLHTTSQAISAAPPMPAGMVDAAQTRVEEMRRRELRVVQSRSAIETPTVQFRAQWLP